jgi:anti-sigma-K factor RskA
MKQAPSDTSGNTSKGNRWEQLWGQLQGWTKKHPFLAVVAVVVVIAIIIALVN